PNTAVALLAQLDREEHDRFLSFLDPLIERELRELMTYPEDRAGRLMDRRIGLFRETMTVAQAIKRLRGLKHRPLRTIFLVDEEQKLTSRVELVDLVVAEPGRKLYQLAQPVATAVNVFTPREEVVEHLEKTRLPNLPVIDSSGRLVGIVRHAELVKAVEEEAMADIQTMVGAGAEERALSKVFFSVRKRLPWLHINLLTAFLAAAVVGLFESTIARFTALAVLLPVVAGQAGNA
ncbi:MAG: CBS domain-containing protein, partial [Nitrospinaceae bacterium]|nr:magnesium transporter [Nitrospinaceae bacterium]NIR54232.1 magnesium transporter [Nitrospinaceae bacterium]NIS84647.1 magnesium transporter [Nitrospinaceae bacterium]NIT81442.1 magnesium transporter [Nitrospinaceae bacterium]NIU43725.1 magnesium transporter [Nitrospinaceae bacterium]